MKANLTELVQILDCSGSMLGLEADTVGGFNSMLKKQLNNDGDVLVTTAFFSTGITIVHDRLNINDVMPLTEQDYEVGGCTALIDAIGNMIEHIKIIHKYAREEDVPEHTIFIITTDGMENASHEFTSDEVKKLITEQKEKGWEFLFLGANIDAVETARYFGIEPSRAANYNADPFGTRLNFEVLSQAISQIRANIPLVDKWKEKIDKDFISRNKK